MDAFIAWTGWPIVGDFLKLVPGLVLFPLTLMLACKKFGNKGLITYSLSYDAYTAPRMTNLALTNCKDKPLIVHALYIIVDRHVLVPLKEFSPPLVIKGLESALVECDPVSSYRVGEHPFNISFANVCEIYVVTTGGRFKCDADYTPNLLSIAQGEGYQHVHTTTHLFNNRVYDDRVRYGLTFSYKGNVHTAFIGIGGLIGLEWPFQINALRPESIVDAATVKAVLEDLYGGEMGSSLNVVTLNSLEGTDV